MTIKCQTNLLVDLWHYHYLMQKFVFDRQYDLIGEIKFRKYVILLFINHVINFHVQSDYTPPASLGYLSACLNRQRICLPH